MFSSSVFQLISLIAEYLDKIPCFRETLIILKSAPKKKQKITKTGWKFCHRAPFMCHLSCVTCQMSHITWHLTPDHWPLCSFSCYESPRKFGDVAVGGLMINRVKTRFFLRFQLSILRNTFFYQNSIFHSVSKLQTQTDK